MLNRAWNTAAGKYAVLQQIPTPAGTKHHPANNFWLLRKSSSSLMEYAIA